MTEPAAPPIVLPLRSGESALRWMHLGGLLGALACAPVLASGLLPFMGWVGVGTTGLWVLVMVGIALMAWTERASDVALGPAGLVVLSGPHRGVRLDWERLRAWPIGVRRRGELTVLTLGGRALAHCFDAEEAASLARVAETVRAAADDRRPTTPPDPHVFWCPGCGAPLRPAGSDTVRCGACDLERVVPDGVGAASVIDASRQAIAAAVQELSRWPTARRSNLALLAVFPVVGVAWPLVTASGLSMRGGAYGLLDWATLVTVGWGFAWTAPSLVGWLVSRRRAFTLLSVRFAAVAPPGPERPWGCRGCGSPLPGPAAFSTTPAVARCAACDSDNVVGLGLVREAVDAAVDAGRLSATLAEARAVQRTRVRLVALHGVLLLAGPWFLADLLLR